MIYKFENEALKWNRGARIPTGANLEETSKALMRLRHKDGYLLPENVTDAAEASPESSAWAPFFEWDNELAARGFREAQAGDLLRSLVIVKIGGEEVTPIRAFSVVTLSNGQRSYEPTPLVIRHRDQRKELLATVQREYEAVDRKHRELLALMGAVVDTAEAA
jgi:hypothetical protein